MLKILSRTTFASACILVFLGSVLSGKDGGKKESATPPESGTSQSITHEGRKEIRALIDSIRNLDGMLKIDSVTGERIRRSWKKSSPDGEWVEVTIVPWDGKSEINPDSLYSHTPEQEENFTKAMIKTLIPAHLTSEDRNIEKIMFLDSLQGSMNYYLQFLDSMRLHLDSTNPQIDSIFYFRDSVYQHWEKELRYRESIYERLKSIDMDSL